MDKLIVQIKEIITNNTDYNFADLALSLHINEREVHLSDCKKKDITLTSQTLYFNDFENKIINTCCIKEVSDLYSSFIDTIVGDCLYMLDSVNLLSSSLSADNNFLNGDIFSNINADIDDLDLALSTITHNYLKISGDTRFDSIYINIINKVEKYIFNKYKSPLSVAKIKKLTKDFHNLSDILVKTSVTYNNSELGAIVNAYDFNNSIINDINIKNLDADELKIRETLIKLFVGRRVTSRKIIYLPLWVYEVLRSFDSSYLGNYYQAYGKEVDKAAEILFNESSDGDPCYNYDTAYKTAVMLDK